MCSDKGKLLEEIK